MKGPAGKRWAAVRSTSSMRMLRSMRSRQILHVWRACSDISGSAVYKGFHSYGGAAASASGKTIPLLHDSGRTCDLSTAGATAAGEVVAAKVIVTGASVADVHLRDGAGNGDCGICTRVSATCMCRCDCSYLRCDAASRLRPLLHNAVLKCFLRTVLSASYGLIYGF